MKRLIEVSGTVIFCQKKWIPQGLSFNQRGSRNSATKNQFQETHLVPYFKSSLQPACRRGKKKKQFWWQKWGHAASGALLWNGENCHFFLHFFSSFLGGVCWEGDKVVWLTLFAELSDRSSSQQEHWAYLIQEILSPKEMSIIKLRNGINLCLCHVWSW